MRIGATLITLLVFVVLLLVSTAYGQNHNNHWYFGNQQAIDFSSGAPVALNDSKMLSIEANSSYSHPENGQLLIYTNGESIWNANHDIMPNGSDLWGHQSATQGTIICPLPASPHMLYVFHIDRNGFAQNYNGSLNYSIVDLRLENGLGDVLSDSKNIELMTESTEKLTIIPHANQCGFWVIGHKRNSNEFFAHLLDDQGISEAVTSTVGSIHEADSSTATIGEMTASLKGDRIALLIHQKQLIELFKFDRESGKLSSVISLEGEYHDYGIEFSPNGELLYVSNFAKKSSLRQYVVSEWNKKQADSTKLIIGQCEKDELKFGGLQLGPDGVLYLKRSTGDTFPDSLGAILYPNKVGKACGFKKNYLFLPLGFGAHAMGPELNFSNLISMNALPFASECFDGQGNLPKNNKKSSSLAEKKSNELD
jgi:hypothetical protein